MAHTKKSRRRSKRGKNNHLTWIVAGIAGAVVMIIAALALISRQNDTPGQTAFDADFEPEVTGAPRVAVTQDVIDYGEIKLGTTVNTVFNVRNTGDEPLVVLGEPRVELVEGC